MSQNAGAQAVEEIRQQVACPKCEYSLYGLRGAMVSCPECGELCDIAALITRRWTKPWYQAPGFSPLAYPATVGLAGLILAFFTSMVTRQAALVSGIFVITILSYVATLIWLYHRAGWFGVLGGLGACVILYLMLLGALILTAIAFVLVRVREVGGFSNQLEGWIILLFLLLGLAILGMGQRAEQILANACIGRYLAKKRLP